MARGWRCCGFFSSGDVVVVQSPALDDLELLFARDTRWTHDVGTVEPKL